MMMERTFPFVKMNEGIITHDWFIYLVDIDDVTRSITSPRRFLSSTSGRKWCMYVAFEFVEEVAVISGWRCMPPSDSIIFDTIFDGDVIDPYFRFVVLLFFNFYFDSQSEKIKKSWGRQVSLWWRHAQPKEKLLDPLAASQESLKNPDIKSWQRAPVIQCSKSSYFPKRKWTRKRKWMIWVDFFHQLDRLDIPAAATVSARIVTKTTLTRLIRLYFSIYSCYSIPPFDHLTNFRSIFNGISLNFWWKCWWNFGQFLMELLVEFWPIFGGNLSNFWWNFIQFLVEFYPIFGGIFGWNSSNLW